MNEETFIYDGFLTSILLKGLISLVETVSGITLLLVPAAKVYALSETAVGLLPHIPPFTLISTHLIDLIGSYTPDTVLFVAGYLFIRGSAKLVLIIMLLLNKLWAFPSLLAVMGALVVYQIYQIATTNSIIVIAITVFDLIVMYFVWREWRIVVKRLQAHA